MAATTSSSTPLPQTAQLATSRLATAFPTPDLVGFPKKLHSETHTHTLKSNSLKIATAGTAHAPNGQGLPTPETPAPPTVSLLTMVAPLPLTSATPRFEIFPPSPVSPVKEVSQHNDLRSPPSENPTPTRTTSVHQCNADAPRFVANPVIPAAAYLTIPKRMTTAASPTRPPIYPTQPPHRTSSGVRFSERQVPNSFSPPQHEPADPNPPRRRKQLHPRRSLPASLTREQKDELYVFKLDVYTRFFNDPMSLLGARGGGSAGGAIARAALVENASRSGGGGGGGRRDSSARDRRRSTGGGGGERASGGGSRKRERDRKDEGGRRQSERRASNAAAAGSSAASARSGGGGGGSGSGGGGEEGSGGSSAKRRRPSVTTRNAAQAEMAASASAAVGGAGQSATVTAEKSERRGERSGSRRSSQAKLTIGTSANRESMDVDEKSPPSTRNAPLRAATELDEDGSANLAGSGNAPGPISVSSLRPQNHHSVVVVSVDKKKTSKNVAPISPVSPDVLRAYAEEGRGEGNYVVTWTKNTPLHIPEDTEGYELLASDEVQVCSTLRLLPMMYLTIKETLLSARHHRGTFRKRDAQSWCRVDVNKTGKIYDWFLSKGWLVSPPPRKGSSGSVGLGSSGADE